MKTNLKMSALEWRKNCNRIQSIPAAHLKYHSVVCVTDANFIFYFVNKLGCTLHFTHRFVMLFFFFFCFSCKAPVESGPTRRSRHMSNDGAMMPYQSTYGEPGFSPQTNSPSSTTVEEKRVIVPAGEQTDMHWLNIIPKGCPICVWMAWN